MAKNGILIAYTFQDIQKQLDLYHTLPSNDPIPEKFPKSLWTTFNVKTPLAVYNPLDGVSYNVRKFL